MEYRNFTYLIISATINELCCVYRNEHYSKLYKSGEYMKVKVIEENMILYSFPAENKERLGINIYILVEGKKAIAIDVGYEEHFSLVLDDLRSKGIEVTKVLPSHFHPDHIDGILLLEECEIYGNKYAADTISMFYNEPERLRLQPTHQIKSGDSIDFGNFNMKLKHAPGHSDCSMQIVINNKYLHTGDLYMLSDENQQVLPFVKYKGIQEHIKSLIDIQQSECEKYLLSHGSSPISNEEIDEGIDNRIKYLKAIYESKNKISVEDALAEVTQEFAFLKWRDSV